MTIAVALEAGHVVADHIGPCLGCGKEFDRHGYQVYCPPCQARYDERDAYWFAREAEARWRHQRDQGPKDRLDPETVLLFARAHGRKRRRLSKIEYRTWAQRFEIEAGLRELPDFDGEIPKGNTADERRLIEWIVYLYQCRAGWASDSALPLDRRFLSAWTGMSEYRVRVALYGLRERGLICDVGKTSGLVKTTLYVFGTRRRIKSWVPSPTPTRALGRSPRYMKPRMTYEDALKRLKKVRRKGKQAWACCPAHDDRRPSLSIREADTPGVGFVVYCHAGCEWQSVVKQLAYFNPRARSCRRSAESAVPSTRPSGSS
jgi:hypothetical protein